MHGCPFWGKTKNTSSTRDQKPQKWGLLSDGTSGRGRRVVVKTTDSGGERRGRRKNERKKPNGGQGGVGDESNDGGRKGGL